MECTYDNEGVLVTSEVCEWRRKRRRKGKNGCGLCQNFLNHECSTEILGLFFCSINILIILQLSIGIAAVFVIQYCHLWFLLDASLIVSPIVFPLAFSINIDFQRREKILEKLGDLKSSFMVFYLCMREWTHASGLGSDWLDSMRIAMKCFALNVHEYLVTDKDERRQVILTALYSDISVIHRLFWEIRTSNLPNNSPLVSRMVKTLTDMSVSFECLQNLREYRSSRAIRSFNKVMVFCLPILLSPHFVHLGKKSENEWVPYYISVVSVFIFSTLQGVHDKLDNPFDGMGEDDIDLDVFEAWAVKVLEFSNITKATMSEKKLAEKKSLLAKLNTLNGYK